MADKKIKNLNDVRNRLEVLYLNLEKGHVRAADAKEMANIAGKMISSGKLQLERKVFMKDDAKVPFLDC